MNDEQKQLVGLLAELTIDNKDDWKNILAKFLGYEVARNPMNPESEWSMLVHQEFEPGEQAVLAVKTDIDLNLNTNIRDIRKLHRKVVDLRQSIGATYSVPLAAFIGNQRIIIYRLSGNRDDRLDLSSESVKRVSLYATYFIERLKKEHIQLQEDEFGFGYIIEGLDDLFKRELSVRFNHMIQLYRKKFAEVIVADHELRKNLWPLVTSDAQRLMRKSNLSDLVEHSSFKAAVGCVVDTVILRQLLRRFLEAYHGVETFNLQDDLKDLGLGVGEGKMEDILQQVASVYWNDIDDTRLQKIVQKESKANLQLEFTELFSEDEEEITANISFKEGRLETYPLIYERLRHQFQLAYGGDLFAGSVAAVTTKIEDNINAKYPGLIVKLWADIASNQYNFRYEDLPPEILQHQYEASMSRTIQIRWGENETPIIFYGEDLQEQKTKGAYYTDTRLVTYMVKKSLEPIFQCHVKNLRSALMNESDVEARAALDKILDLKIIDITCGGGSFLRGVFYWLSESQKQLTSLLERYELGESLLPDYPMFHNDNEGLFKWEKHILLNMLYGIDIDYKALIICSQTLTLAALRNWKTGKSFAQLIGLTLVHQNALMTPIPNDQRKTAFKAYQNEIAELINLRKIAQTDYDSISREKADILRRNLQGVFKKNARKLFDDHVEVLNVEVLELQFPEVFFNNDGSWKEDGGFDIALGNPPWENWKPNAEEFFEPLDPKYRKSNKQTKLKIQQELYKKHPHLEERWLNLQEKYAFGSAYFLNPNFYEYQRWKVDGRFTGGDINLYKLALERFYQLLKTHGVGSIIVPGNIVTDRGATGLRHLLFKQSVTTEILCFTNKKRIFPMVGELQKFSLVSFNKEKPQDNYEFKAFFYRTDPVDLYNNELKMNYPVSLAEQVSPSILTLLEFRTNEEMALIRKLYKFPMISEYLPSWNLVVGTELHSSNQSPMFIDQESAIPRLGGKHIQQYRTLIPSDSFVNEDQFNEFWLNREKHRANNKLNTPYLGTHHFYRLAFRDTARATDRRTIIASVLPKGVTSIDTLKIAQPFQYILLPDGSVGREELYDCKQLLVMTGLLNSFVVDFLMRRKVDKHVSGFLMNQMPIPRINYEHKYFEEIALRVALLVCTSVEYNELSVSVGLNNYRVGVNDPSIRQEIQNQIDAYVADIYELTREEIIYILSTFESVGHKEEMRRISQGVVESFDKLQTEGALYV